MKQKFSSIIVVLMSVAVLSVSLFVAGCNTNNGADPDAKIPDVPPSTRGGSGGSGGGPGAPGAPK